MTTSHHGRSTRADKRGKTERPRKPSKIQPILLDRLAHALAAHGVSLKRTDVLQVAAAAFGYHNANEFSAADLVVQPATPVAQATLPDGDRFLVVRDPIANSAYGVELGFLEQVVAEERREQFGVSPYGHLLDLSGLLDVDLDALGTARPPAGATLHIAVCEHKHGTSGWVGLTKADLYRQIANFCTEYWREVERDAGPIDDYDGDEAIVRGYFDGHDSETLYVEEARLPAAPAAPAPRSGPGAQAPEDALHPRYPYQDYRSFMFVTGQTLTYADWVEQSLARERSRDSGQLWLDRAQAPGMGAIVCNDLHHVAANGVHLRPGTLARLKALDFCNGGVTATLEFGDDTVVSYTDRDRGGLLPFIAVQSDSTPGGRVSSIDWMPAEAAMGLPIGTQVKIGTPFVRSGETLPAGTCGAIESHRALNEGRVQICVRIGDALITYTERLVTGVFPLSVDAGSTEDSTLHTREDWSGARAQGATTLSYRDWSRQREAEDIHLKESWLTEDQVLHDENVGLGEELVIRIHGSLKGYDQERNAYGETVFKPGDTVYLDAVDDHYNATGLLITVRTRSGITLDLETRDGYFPVSLPNPARDANEDDDTALANAGAVSMNIVLMTGAVVQRDGKDPLIVVGIAEDQPLREHGLLAFSDEDDIVHLARYDGAWKLHPPSAMTYDQLRILGRPDFGEEIVFSGVDCHIEAHDFPTEQPLAAAGIVIFVDQYRETHMCARTGTYWEIVQPHDLTPAQAKAVEGLI